MSRSIYFDLSYSYAEEMAIIKDIKVGQVMLMYIGFSSSEGSSR